MSSTTEPAANVVPSPATQAAPRHRPLAASAFVLLLPMLLSASAWAQSVPPEPRITRTYPVWIGYGIGAVLVVMIVLVSLMPSKRAHQD